MVDIDIPNMYELYILTFDLIFLYSYNAEFMIKKFINDNKNNDNMFVGFFDITYDL